METRLLVAYALILLLVLLATGGLTHLTRDWRARRRYHRRFDRVRAERRDARIAEESNA